MNPAVDVLVCDAREGLLAGLSNLVHGPRPLRADHAFALAPQLLARIAVRAVRRQEPHVGPDLSNRLPHARLPVGLEIVQHHHIPWLEARRQKALGPGEEREVVERPSKRLRGERLAASQRRDHAHLPPGAGDRVDDPLAPRRSPVGPQEFGGHGRFIGKDQTLDAEAADRPSPVLAARHDVRAIPLGGVERLFFREKPSRRSSLWISVNDPSMPHRSRSSDSVASGRSLASRRSRLRWSSERSRGRPV